MRRERTTTKDSIGGWRPKGFVDSGAGEGLQAGLPGEFRSHLDAHELLQYVWRRTRRAKAVLEAFQKRHMYGATDNILAEFAAGEHIMGDAFTATSLPEL